MTTMIVRLAALAWWAATCLPCWAADAVPAAAFFRHPALIDARLSPSGTRVALNAESNGRVGLFVVDLSRPASAAKAVAYFSDADVRGFNWVDDERLVFNVVDLQAGLAEYRYLAPGLFSVRHDGEQLRGLVARQGDGDPRGRQRILGANHGLLHVPTALPTGGEPRAPEVVVGEWRARNREWVDVRPMWLDVTTGRTRTLDGLEGAPTSVLRWWFDAQGRPRAALERDGGRDRLHAYQPPRDGEPGRWVMLTEGQMAAVPFWPAWVGSDGSMSVLHAHGPAGETVVSPLDPGQRRPGTPLVVVPGFDFSGTFIGSDDGMRLLGVRADAETEQTVWFDAGRKALQESVDRALPGRVNRISCRRCGQSDEVVLVRSWSDRQPAQLLLRQPAADGGKPRWQLVGSALPEIDARRMGRVELQRIRARDGRMVPLWITRPAGAPDGQPLPTVVMVHGGPWLRQGHWHFAPMAQFLASRGYLVLEPEFRGSSGYGRAHERAGDRQFGQAMQDDVSDALLWAQAQKLASDKACIVGGSYGGYSTLMGLIRTPELYRCGSAWFAVADLLLYLEGGWFVDDDLTASGRRHVLPTRVGDADRDRDMLRANSPVEQAHRITRPLQLVWGAEDRRVPLAHGERLRSAMGKAGLEPEWVVYEGEGHGLRKAANRVDMAERLEAFLARHLK